MIGLTSRALFLAAALAGTGCTRYLGPLVVDRGAPQDSRSDLPRGDTRRDLPRGDTHRDLPRGDTRRDLPDQLAPDLPPSCSTAVYSTANAHDGNLGGRTGADQLCVSEKPAGLACSKIHALISVDAADTIAAMPTSYGYGASKPLCWVHATTLAKTQFATSWADMLDGSISVSRKVGTGRDTHVWTGSKNDGTLADDFRFHCTGWTATSYGPHWNFHHSYAGNVGCGAVSMPDVTADWLYAKSPFSKKKQYGPTTCCFYGDFICPSLCPADSYLGDGDEVMCAGSARLMCVCVP
jgi:hypothetical protein